VSLHLLYGGTFDPIHLGHLAVARAALAAVSAAQLDFVPAADPPHRAPPGAGFEDRAALVELALATEPAPDFGRWGIDRCEGRRPGQSFTVDTLREWRARHGIDAPLGFVLGADAFLGLPGWREWPALFELAHLLVACRPGSELDPQPPALKATCAGRWTDAPGDLAASAAGRVFIVRLPRFTRRTGAARRDRGSRSRRIRSSADRPLRARAAPG